MKFTVANKSDAHSLGVRSGKEIGSVGPVVLSTQGKVAVCREHGIAVQLDLKPSRSRFKNKVTLSRTDARMDFKMTPAQVEALLYELCVVLGFCLPPEANERLKSDPPADVDEFADAVIRAEGLDPYADISLNLRRDVCARIAKHFRDAEDEYFRQRQEGVT